MQDFKGFLEQAKSFEVSLWKFLIGSALLSGILVAGQFDNFPRGFSALAEVCGVVAGMAAIIPAYMRRMTHPSDRTRDELNYFPMLLPARTFLTLMLTIGMFYWYYSLASVKNQYCLFPLAAGSYLFFRVIAESIHHFYMAERQEALWNSMTEEQKERWRDTKEDLIKLLDDTESDNEAIEVQLKLMQARNEEWERKSDEERRAELRETGRWGRFVAFLYPIRRPTLKTRTGLGLLSRREREHAMYLLQARAERLEQENRNRASQSSGG
jgi:hypothetical protein